ncbi:hypothetical protein BKA82DRAFT_1004934 [Pisolithus tinctorius]|uniref:Uncharacterized protein n=1 Tax=Pisolithus tinctorius Marx 270 TaxID=870435 RepID=A0A0C3IQ53_PISTI|nr:hypothetical protein BKA82DRAFT_1004934 [Pisolithus tinctorius]KIN99082.1 hypothetical protein M404DRAFT_1004934 [Pisolithus tinctorius Marx 270]
MREALGEVPDVVVPYVGAGMGPSTNLSQIHLCTSSALRQEARVHTDERIVLVCYDRSLLVPTWCLEMARRPHCELYKRVGTSTFSATNSASPIAFNITLLVFTAADRSPDTAAGLLVLINYYYIGTTLILDRASQRAIIRRNTSWTSGRPSLVEGWERAEQW